MTRSRGADALISALFALLFLLPLADMAWNLDRSGRLNENRKVARFPQTSLAPGSVRSFLQDYGKYFDDNFGFRNALVRLNFILRYRLLGTSPSPLAVKGREGWLFYTGDGEMNDHRGIVTYDEKRLRNWARALQLKKAWLQGLGIRYVLFIPPNKSSIYGEFVPGVYDRVRDRTALDDLVDHLRAHTDVKVVDSRRTLMDGKNTGPVYFKTDTHWNQLGAFLAYQDVMKVVAPWFPGMKPMTMGDLHLVREKRAGGDLAGMMGGTDFLEDEDVRPVPNVGRRPEVGGITDGTRRPVVVEVGNASSPRAVVFQDSFFPSVAPYLSPHFQSVKYVWQPWNASLDVDGVILAHRPDLVIEEILERLVKIRMGDFARACPGYLGGDCATP
jgi:alginate O-acetyltransferase complex protein AlgJ